MMNSSEISVCGKCSSPVEVRREGSSQGLFCMKCDWAVVTTYISEILRDGTSYEVSITSGEDKNDLHIRTIAKLTGVNFLAARKLLQTDVNFVLLTGVASQIIETREALRLVGLSYEIKPSFPY
ncbi:MAG: hypothetical protein HYR68_05575 [Burkholderiales bacterium]|nr:hypothetical protein [Burkholderiales bacterium]MBI3728248.1 hypothetical protein [Burkholderiales bacterium]